MTTLTSCSFPFFYFISYCSVRVKLCQRYDPMEDLSWAQGHDQDTIKFVTKVMTKVTTKVMTRVTDTDKVTTNAPFEVGLTPELALKLSFHHTWICTHLSWHSTGVDLPPELTAGSTEKNSNDAKLSWFYTWFRGLSILRTHLYFSYSPAIYLNCLFNLIDCLSFLLQHGIVIELQLRCLKFEICVPQALRAACNYVLWMTSRLRWTPAQLNTLESIHFWLSCQQYQGKTQSFLGNADSLQDCAGSTGILTPEYPRLLSVSLTRRYCIDSGLFLYPIYSY